MLDFTEGIVLKTTKYSESSIIAKIFTKKYGTLSFIIPGIRSSKNKQKGNLFEPINTLNLEIYFREQRNLNRIKSYHSALIYKQLPFDITKRSIALFCVELMAKCLKEQEINETLYNYFAAFLFDLDEKNDALENKPLFFLLETASILGFEPSLQNILQGNYFNLENGRFENSIITHSCLSAYDTSLFKQMLAMYYDKQPLKFNSTERKIVLDNLLLYFRWHVTDFFELKTPAILSEILR